MESSLFSQSLSKGLVDKVYDKRKAAALDVERLVRENENSSEKITQIIDALVQDFVYSSVSYARYGGLIGLAATCIALGPSVSRYLDIIVPPILSCFSHKDQKVRYYACESMYNIAKVAKGEVLRFFNSIFDGLCKLSADAENSVKSGADLLDRLMKDIVVELSATYISPYSEPYNTVEQGGEKLPTPSSLPRNTAFSLPQFIPLLSQHLYIKSSAARQFSVSWISTLGEIRDLKLISFLPEFLDGLIDCLNDASEDVRVATNALLEGFLLEIKQAANARVIQVQNMQESIKQHDSNSTVKIEQETSEKPDDEEKMLKETSVEDDPKTDDLSFSKNEGHGKGTYVPGQGVTVKYGKIVEILVPHLSSSEEGIQKTALLWISVFINIAQDVVIQYTPEIIKAVLPSLAHPVSAIRVIALETNQNLQKLVLETPIHLPPEPTASKSDPSGGAKQQQKKTILLMASDTDPFDYQATVANLRLQFLNQNEETRVASLDWLLMLHKKAPTKILVSDDGTFPALLKTLSDSSEEVVRRDLQLLAQISSYSDHEYFRSFIVSLLSLFSTDRRLLETRGSLIIRQLCMSLDPERIYCVIADILEQDEDLEFASVMVQNLNIILITASELSDLRRKLRNLELKDNQRLFNTLYKSWCHNAVSAFSLCLLSQVYEHAANMLQVFAELEMTVNMLIQVDKLVQLLESPVFTYLRLQLLEPDKYPYLFKCLYGILMLLPQSSAFSTLRSRLNSVSSLGFLHVLPKSPVIATTSTDRKQSSKQKMEEINTIKYQDLLAHFKSVQSKHENQRKASLSSSTRPPFTHTLSGSVRSRRTARYNNDASLNSSNQTAESKEKVVGSGGIRSGMMNLGLTHSTTDNASSTKIRRNRRL